MCSTYLDYLTNCQPASVTHTLLLYIASGWRRPRSDGGRWTTCQRHTQTAAGLAFFSACTSPGLGCWPAAWSAMGTCSRPIYLPGFRSAPSHVEPAAPNHGNQGLRARVSLCAAPFSSCCSSVRLQTGQGTSSRCSCRVCSECWLRRSARLRVRACVRPDCVDAWMDHDEPKPRGACRARPPERRHAYSTYVRRTPVRRPSTLHGNYTTGG